ncbi:4'-phosphopantetheinyl transferase superfamily protein [bacterium]|nr:4'-phosphopantetheinyl transferase superfamily protein [bacterium]
MIKVSIEIEDIKDFGKICLSKVGKFFTSEEIPDRKASLNSYKVRNLAGKFAAKKSFFKCLGIEEDFRKIQIKKNSSGKPYIEILDESLKNSLKNSSISVSISHTGKVAVAICLIYENGKGI